MKYRANAEHDGVYVCLDPGEGVSFANSLTAKVGSGAKTTLRGKGMHNSLLVICCTIIGTTGLVDIRFIQKLHSSNTVRRDLPSVMDNAPVFYLPIT